MAEQTDFALSVNVGTAGPVDVLMQDPTDGPHKVEILDVRLVTKEGEGGKTSLRFSVADVEPGSPTLGVQTMVVVGTDWSKPFNVGHLVNSLLSVGASAEKVKGTLNLRPEVWKGKTAYIIVKAPPEGEVDEQGRQKRADKNFLTPAQYEAAKRSYSMRAANSPARPAASTGNGAVAMAPQTSAAAPTATAPVAAPTAAPAAGAGLGDLFG